MSWSVAKLYCCTKISLKSDSAFNAAVPMAEAATDRLPRHYWQIGSYKTTGTLNLTLIPKFLYFTGSDVHVLMLNTLNV